MTASHNNRGDWCMAEFEIPTPKGLLGSSINNPKKKLYVRVVFKGSDFTDEIRNKYKF